jgi:hypothetical protein
MKCRHCLYNLSNLFVDLDFSPPSNAYLSIEDLSKSEPSFPLKVLVCEKCWLVQTQDFNDADELFNDTYAYFSSTSSSFLKHARDYVHMISERLALNENSFVVELASNDGYLLKNFLEREIPCLGVEPTKSTAEAAQKIDIPTLIEFFGVELASQISQDYQKADLIIGNNVFAHVPDINDFSSGIKKLLSSNGTVTLEFPQFKNLLEHSQFDTIYHEHYSYLSLTSASNIFSSNGLRIYDVEELQTHGGSLRLYGCHQEAQIPSSPNVLRLLDLENEIGLKAISTYQGFQDRVEAIKYSLLEFLINAHKDGLIVDAYGAAAKGNTLLNFSGVKRGLIRNVYDAAPSKQDMFMPGSHIPIKNPECLITDPPDILLILPWNISSEVIQNFNDLRATGMEFYTAIPELRKL